MNGATFRALREALGIPREWLCDALGVDARALRRWEGGITEHIPDDAAAAMLEFEQIANAEVEYQLDRIMADLDIFDSGAEIDDLLELRAPDNYPVLEVPKKVFRLVPNASGNAIRMPPQFFRAIAARVRWELDGRAIIEYAREEEEDD